MRFAAIPLMLALAACGKPEATSEEGLAWIAKGSPEAVAFGAAALRAESGAHTSEMLADALGRAMQVAPERVLALVGTSDRFSPRAICLPSLFEDWSARARKAELEKSRTAIEGVRDPRLARAREECLAEVAQAQTALNRQEE